MGDSRPPISRRAVNALLGIGLLTTLTGFVGTTLSYLWPLRSTRWSDLLMGSDGPLLPDDISVNSGVVAHSRVGKVLVVRTDKRLIAVEATCTHLGCLVAWNADSQQIECPCHGAHYNLRGEVLRGPARESLARVELNEQAEGIRVISTEA